MGKVLSVFIALFVLLASATAAETVHSLILHKPVLKLLKRKAGQRYRKIIIIKRNGERKVLVRVKKVRRHTVRTKQNTAPIKDAFDNPQPSGMITDTYSKPKEEKTVPLPPEPVSQPNESNTSVITPASDVPADTNTTIAPPLPEQRDQSPPAIQTDNNTTSNKTRADNLPATNWKRHYLALAVGASARKRMTKIDTAAIGTPVRLKNSDHIFTADGTAYTFSDNEGYPGIEAGYLYKPYVLGSAFYLGGYYDSDLFEFKGAYQYTFDDIAAVYPGLKIGGALSFDNGDNTKYDGTALFGSFSLDKRLLNGMIVGLAFQYLERTWFQKEEFFGTVTCEDKESALRLTLDMPL